MNTTRIEPSSFRFSIWLDRTIPLVSKISEDRISLRDRETLSLSVSLFPTLEYTFDLDEKRKRSRERHALSHLRGIHQSIVIPSFSSFTLPPILLRCGK